MALPETTNAEVVAKTGAIQDAISALALASTDAKVASVTVKGTVAGSSFIDHNYRVELPYGTVLADLTAADVVVTATDANATVAATTADGGATWTVVVTAEDGTTTETYTINATVSEMIADTFEADNTYSTAKTIVTDGTVQAHNITTAGDEDWVKFSAEAGKNYQIDTFNLVGDPNNVMLGEMDTYIELYDTNGITLIDSNDDNIGSESEIFWNCTTTGTYYSNC